MRFLDALLEAQKGENNIIIPDIKNYSPKEGDLLRNRNPVELALLLEAAGAPVISVVTEEKEFHGSMDLLREICAKVKVPVLRKDFIETEADLKETKAAGADAILLMFSCLPYEKLEYLYHKALEYGLDPFVETHNQEQIQMAKRLGATLVGINNRNILELECDSGDVNQTGALSKYIPSHAFLISESSMMNQEDVNMALKAGACAALVGTAILQAADTAGFYQKLARPCNLKICGIMNQTSLDICTHFPINTLGFVVNYPIFVPWNMDEATASSLIRQVPPDFNTAIVTGGSPMEIIQLAERLKPDILQLHYKETLEDTIKICNGLKNTGIKIIKTLPLTKEAMMSQFGTHSIQEIISLLDETDIYGILVDTRTAENAASIDTAGSILSKTDESQGIGKNTIDLTAYINRISRKQVIAAGGISSDNLQSVLSHTGIRNIDIMTGSEDAPGKKSAPKIESLIQLLK